MAVEKETGRTMQAAEQAAISGRNIVKAGELVEARFGNGVSPSLAARKTLALLIAKAAGDAWKPGPFSMTKRELRGSHESNDRLPATLDELMNIKFSMPTTSSRGRPATLTAALLAWTIHEHDDEGSATVEWEWTEPARSILQGSDYYARLNRAAVLAFRSKYSVTLYELGCLLAGRRDPTWSATIDELRERLGVATGTLTNFADFRRLVLDQAKAEIDQLAAFTMDWQERRGGRNKVTVVVIAFTPKPAPEIDAAADEIDRHAAGRRARRDGKVERLHLVPPAAAEVPRLPAKAKLGGFPTGTLSFGDTEAAFARVARDLGGGWDIDLIAAAFRTHMGSRLVKLRDQALMASWEGFCRSYAERRPSL